ncbi:MAG TPA: heparinase II/III family protein [Bryobacteraceae bacterium]|nr:heparinase II/III family protein [Bryobacteraceae bacterium]
MTRVIAALLATSAVALAVPDDPLRTLRADHPRLIVLDSDIERIRSFIQQYPQARKLHADLVKEADKLMTAPPVEYKLVGPRLLAQSRRCLERIYTLALLYRLDGKRQYLDRALRELHAAADFKDWNPSHFLDTAEMTHAFGIAYDWFYPALSPDDRTWIRKAIVEKGLDPALMAYDSGVWWATSRFNWNQVCNGGISIGALAIAEDEPDKSRAVLKHALDSIPLALASYAPDGGWAEGPAYWSYATSYTVYFLAALDSALGTDFGLSLAKGFDRTGRFRIYFSGPSGRMFNYADAHDRTEPASEMFWLARRFAEPVYAWQEQRLMESSAAPDPLDLIWYDPEARSPRQENWPLDAIFHSVQVAFLRSAWDDPSAIFVGIKGGDNKANHGHLDLGSFVLDAGGVRWALDLGPDDYNLPAYFGARRWSYYRLRTEAHNTITIDDENQDPRAEAAITGHLFTPDWSWVDVDLSHAYHHRLKQFRRRIGITQGQQAFVQDVLESEQPVEVLWGMMTDAEITLNGQTAELKKGDWSLSAEILSPRHAVFDIVPATAPAPQTPNPGVRKLVVRLGEKITELDLRVTLTPHRTSQPKPKVTPRFGT